MLELASHFTVSNLLARDMFQERIRAGREVYVHEFLYPIFQAYDAVTMDVDLDFEVCTNLDSDKFLKEKPRDQKIKLAYEIVKIYHGEKVAQEAEINFIETFSKGGIPKDIETVKIDKNTPLVEVFLKHKFVASKSEFNRLNKEGAIKEIESGVYRVGKHRFLKIETF